ncbi:MAG: hypothetical protein ABSF56_02385 [Minisyncoccia bacterium]|jgi:hypothetical protein
MMQVTDVNSLFYKLNGIGNAVTILLVSLAVIWIVVSVVRFIMASGENRAVHRASVLWGIVGLAVILSIWGIINIFGRTFGLGNAQNQWRSSRDANSLIMTPPVSPFQ